MGNLDDFKLFKNFDLLKVFMNDCIFDLAQLNVYDLEFSTDFDYGR